MPLHPDGGDDKESEGLWNGQIDTNISIAPQATGYAIHLYAED